MQMGLIADVHGDLEALEQALARLHDHHVTRIVCAGDVVKKGPHSVEVVKLLHAQAVSTIAGNHDREALDERAFDGQTSVFLSQLPQTLSYTIENKHILVAHGAPWSDFVYIYPQTERHVFKRIAREANAHVVILGHTHVPLFAEVDSTRIYNPGSVCGTYTAGSRTFGILSLPDCSFEVFDIASGQPVETVQIKIRR